MRDQPFVFLSAVAGLLVLAALVYFFVPATRVSPESLAASVAREAGGDFFSSLSPCEERQEGEWDCSVPEPGGSGAGGYRVEMRESGCWTAELRRFGEGGLPGRADGCVRIRDQVGVPIPF